MFCEKCGHKNLEGSNYCEKCGSKLVDNTKKNIKLAYTNPGTSYFDGKLIQLIGWCIVGSIITIFTLGICYPYALCLIYDWEIKHTVINGRKLGFDGKAIDLLGNWLKWMVLTIITLGIYSFFIPIKIKEWKTKHTYFIN